MAGVPVISGNLTSLPEVGGYAVIYVDPFNIKSIIKEISKRQLIIFQNTEKSRIRASHSFFMG